MKKVICMVLALMVCLSLALPVFAAEGEFVPSISYKGAPGIRSAELDGEDVDTCIVVTPISGARNKSTDITQEERDLLIKVYDDLKNGTTKLPISEDYVIRDLVDLSFEYIDCRCKEDHGNKDEKLKQKGITFKQSLHTGRWPFKQQILIYVITCI